VWKEEAALRCHWWRGRRELSQPSQNKHESGGLSGRLSAADISHKRDFLCFFDKNTKKIINSFKYANDLQLKKSSDWMVRINLKIIIEYSLNIWEKNIQKK
jgi:hypothetical protein